LFKQIISVSLDNYYKHINKVWQDVVFILLQQGYIYLKVGFKRLKAFRTEICSYKTTRKITDRHLTVKKFFLLLVLACLEVPLLPAHIYLSNNRIFS